MVITFQVARTRYFKIHHAQKFAVRSNRQSTRLLLRCVDDQAYPDVVYSQDKKIWQCCGTAPGTGNVTCDNPADESFSAPALEALVAIQPSTIESNSTSSASTTTGNNGSSATNVSTSTSTARQTSATSASMSGLNTGAKAGIGIGVALVAMLAIVACIFLCARARRRAKKQSAAQAVPSEAHRGTFAGYAHERNAMVMRQPQEIEGRSRPLQPQELEGRWTPHDLT